MSAPGEDPAALAARLAALGARAWLATLVAAEGSTYRRPGARAVIAGDGAVAGLISGGCLEADLAARLRALPDGRASALVTYDLRADAERLFGLGAGCRGWLEILALRSSPWLEPLGRALEHAPAAGLAVAYDDEGAVPPQNPAWAWTTGGAQGASETGAPLVALAASALAEGRTTTVPVPALGARAFVQRIARVVRLGIFGAGPDAAALARLAGALGWRVSVFDRRPARLADPAFAGCAERRPWDDVERLADRSLDAVVVMTHNLELDRAALAAVLSRAPRYVGLLGPRRRGDELRAALGGARLDVVHTPAGLDLGAEGPEEIALAILAEVTAHLAGRAGGKLRDRGGSIHG